MTIYEVLAYLCLFLAIPNDFRNKRNIFWATAGVFVLIAAIRGLSVGTDTISYYYGFTESTTTNFTEKGESEFLFSWWTYFCRTTINSYDFWMLANYGLMIGLIAWAIFRYSSNRQLSLYLFISCGFYLASFNIMREYIATAFIVLAIAVMSEHWKYRLWAFLLIMLFAVFIHNSAVVALPLLLLYKHNVSKNLQALIILFSFILGFFYLSRLSDSLFSWFIPFVGDRYEGYLTYEGDSGGRGFIGNFGVNVMFLVSLFLAKRSTLEGLWFKTYFLGMIVFNLFGGMYYLTRLTDNLSIVQIIVIPLIANDLRREGKRKQLFYWGYCSLIVVYSVSRFYLKGLSNPDLLPYVVRMGILGM